MFGLAHLDKSKGAFDAGIITMCWCVNAAVASIACVNLIESRGQA